MNNIYFQIGETDPLTPGVVLATVTAATGSTPQKPGSSALFVNGKLIAGTVGGGVVENKVMKYAGRCAVTGESALLGFNLDKDAPDPEEALCGGALTILVDAHPLKHISVLREMQQSIREGLPGVLVTRVTTSGDSTMQIRRYWTTGKTDLPLPAESRDRIMEEAAAIITSGGKTGYREIKFPTTEPAEPTRFLLEPVFPLPRLVIAGAGHVGKAVSYMGRFLGFEVTVIDDRIEFANRKNLPDADNIIVNDIGKGMAELPKDKDTYVVIVTRGHSSDAEALKPCIGSGAAYVGLMGSKVKVATMRARFLENKWATEAEWNEIFTPIGLEIGSQTVEEIAVSIAAQLVRVRRIEN
ncbi:MAG: XdhC family protein [Bacteroidales bacterium]|nr:XdhC family protein [Bacteroidales bacterium]MDT8375021.1 XdhC family protein [Bacteroidales bacterium]